MDMLVYLKGFPQYWEDLPTGGEWSAIVIKSDTYFYLFSLFNIIFDI